MPKRTVILIIILTALTALLVWLAVQNEQKQSISQEESSTSSVVKEQVQKNAELSFVPQSVVLGSATQSATVDVWVKTNNNAIDGVQLELLYDPQVISNVSITSPDQNFFGTTNDSNIIINNIDAERGRVSYALGLNPGTVPKKGEGTVARLSFTLNPINKSAQSTIDFLDKSMVIETTSHESVLSNTTPLQISVVQQ